MARVVIDDACDACWKKGVARTSDVSFTLDERTWYLCREHEKAFAQQMITLLGDPTEGGNE